MASRVVIVGGGFSGAAAAVQIVRRSAEAVAVTVVEPREEVGRGLAYSATDPDHRLNATVDRHALEPDDPHAFERWVASQALAQRDPEARLPDGRCFPRRHDFGSFVADTVRAHAALPNGSSIRHVRDEAMSAVPHGTGWHVHTAAGQALRADLLIVATGNPPPRWPGFVSERAATRRGAIGNPMDTARLHAEIAPTDRVGVLGSGLTALDVISTLLRGGHRGPITVLSRRGLRPRGQPSAQDLSALQSARGVFDAPGGPVPGFIADLGPAPTMRALLRSLRECVRADVAAGRPWHAAFGALRDGVWQFWPGVPEREKQRFVRHLKVWYDVHRFLSAPQNEAIVQSAAQAGAVRFRAARVLQIDATPDARALQATLLERGHSQVTDEAFDAWINCTGIDGSGTHNPFLNALRAGGWLQPGPAGLGFALDGHLCALGRDGVARDTLRVIGPPSVGVCGDTIGAGFIASNLRRTMPSLLATLSRAARESIAVAGTLGARP